MTTKHLIESLCLMFYVWSLRLAFLAAGCWMLYNGWYGCGLTTVVLTVFIGGESSDDKEESEAKK
jgi:hypothetical protein